MNASEGPSPAAREALLALARAGVIATARAEPLPEPPREPDELARPGASFVTLKQRQAGEAADGLRGCIGSLEAVRPLAADVVHNAAAAAARDPRFPPVTPDELEGLDVSVAVLTPPEPLAFASEADLLSKLRPGEDGLVLEADGHRGTFLPAVWESLPDPAEFLRQLRRKAGLPPDFPLERARLERYTSHTVGGPVFESPD
ncbi:MAG: AmmeMemoRadiSam system protein A [Thiohalospira sp.]